ncbi:COX assembly mitochondrial protein homolog isoform X1 [Delphinapterus leucas]|uniref:COX assembly mitochondrial protein n=1 Tax=Delphinapterus leucas TaxID=9749 RepID=A0A7F8KHU0_DELLE|nr:COX assembly mitochondrial protein homolog isoform X1 [Delphinapterus leucas]
MQCLLNPLVEFEFYPRITGRHCKCKRVTEQHLRHVEKDVLIPKIMREKARERCSEQVQGPDFEKVHLGYCHLKVLACGCVYRSISPPSSESGVLLSVLHIHLLIHLIHFTKCCKDSGILMVVKCRKENSALKECLTAYYNDPAFYEECKMEYLKEREEFRKTGIPTKKRLQKLPTSM